MGNRWTECNPVFGLTRFINHNSGSVRKPGCISSYNRVKALSLWHETMASITYRIS